MRLRAAIALLLLAAPAGARATRGRLALSVLAGGGYASDVFVGAGLGSDAFFQLTPAARLDLSLAPRWKLATAADVSYGRYLSSEVTSVVETGAVECRWLAGPAFDASLSVGAEHGSYSVGSPVNPDLPGSPSVTSTAAASASSLLRLRAAGFEWRAAGTAATRSSTSAGVAVPEQDYALLAGAMHSLGERASLAFTYKLGRTDSSDLGFALGSHAVFGLLSWRVGAVDLAAQLQLQTAALDNGTREQLGRLTLSAAYPLTETVALEAVYSFAASDTNDPSRSSASRHLAFLALRWRLAEVEW